MMRIGLLKPVQLCIMKLIYIVFYGNLLKNAIRLKTRIFYANLSIDKFDMLFLGFISENAKRLIDIRRLRI